MRPKILKNEKEYEEALEQADTLISAQPGTPEFDDLELWTLLIEKYEEEHIPFLNTYIENFEYRKEE